MGTKPYWTKAGTSTYADFSGGVARDAMRGKNQSRDALQTESVI